MGYVAQHKEDRRHELRVRRLLVGIAEEIAELRVSMYAIRDLLDDAGYYKRNPYTEAEAEVDDDVEYVDVSTLETELGADVPPTAPF